MGYNCLAQDLLLEAAMSGPSKWHNIRIKKQKVDQVRGKLFSRLSREITVAAKEGGGNPDGNARPRTALERGGGLGGGGVGKRERGGRGGGERAGGAGPPPLPPGGGGGPRGHPQR